MISELNLSLDDYIEIKDIEGLNGLNIYQVKIKDVLKFGEDKYNQLILPFMMNLDIFNLEDDIKNQLTMFDIFFIKEFNEKENYLEMLIDSLKYFFSTENVSIIKDENDCILKALAINDCYILHEKNFETLCEYMLQINQREKIKIEKPPVYEGVNAEKKLAIWKKMTENRRKENLKNSMKLIDIIKMVRYGGLRYISKSEIKNMTLYELYDAYRLIMNEKGFDYSLTCSLAGAELKEGNNPINSWVKMFKTNK